MKVLKSRIIKRMLSVLCIFFLSVSIGLFGISGGNLYAEDISATATGSISGHDY